MESKMIDSVINAETITSFSSEMFIIFICWMLHAVSSLWENCLGLTWCLMAYRPTYRMQFLWFWIMYSEEDILEKFSSASIPIRAFFLSSIIVQWHAFWYTRLLAFEVPKDSTFSVIIFRVIQECPASRY